jgi:Na+/proline symporter
MTFGGLHAIDLFVVLTYLAVVTYLGHRAAAQSRKNEEGFFLAGRKLGKLYQFFLNFGNATDANGAVSTASLVYQQGVSGVWLSFQTLFMNPYYWFMNLWFRRVRLTTVADLFEDRLGSRALARFYAVFQIAASIVVTIGFGNLISYKISASLVVKPEAVWTSTERQSVEGYLELKRLEKEVAAGPLAAPAKHRLETLRDANTRGELRSYVTALEPWSFYLGYTLIVGLYIVLGGMAATALNEAFQGVLIVVFSALLIPFGLAAIGGWGALGRHVPAAMFELFGSAASQVTGWTVVAILFVSIVQINGIIGNMSVSGSARDEFAARFGAVAGTYAKRIMIIMWALAGLIAIALFSGPRTLSDPDAVWGTMARHLLGPGLLGLMMAGVLAANMSTVAAQTMAVSALFVRNVYGYHRSAMSDAEVVRAGRWAIVGALGIGIVAATQMTSVFAVIQLLLTVNVPFGAAVVLIFLWRRLTPAAVWTAVILSAAVNILAPLLVPMVPALNRQPALVQLATPAANGQRDPVYFAKVVRSNPEDPASPLVGRERFHLEIFLLDALGFRAAERSASARFAARFFFDGLFPFALLLLVSLVTRGPPATVVDQFYGKMKTAVGATPELEAAAMAETRRHPGRFDRQKLFPGSSWELTRWDRVDAVGFVACCLVSGAILGLFALLLWAARPG